jgi:hypothetical protein
MNRNMGNIDKGIRVVIAAAIGIMYYLDIIQGNLAYILMAAAIILLVTSLINFCPLYKILGLNTDKEHK